MVRYLIQRDGKTCYLCNAETCKKHNLHKKLIVEHKDNDDTNWQPDNLGMAHRCCNGVKNPHGALPLDRERDSRAPINTLAGPGGSQSEKSSVQRARWLSWINDLKQGPFAQYEVIALKSLADWAPRGLANRELGEESYGVAQTYMKYISQDSEEFGGPLHIFEGKEGKLKGVTCVEYVGAIQKQTQPAPQKELKA